MNRLVLDKEEILYNRYLISAADISEIKNILLIFQAGKRVFYLEEKNEKEIDKEILKKLLVNVGRETWYE